MTQLELAWLAGYLEGEGSFTCPLRNKIYPTIQITFSTVDRDIAEKVANLLGTMVGGPYGPRGKLSKQVYYAARRSGEPAARLMRDLIPFMGERRTAAIKVALAKWDSRASRHREPGLVPDCHPDRPHYSRGLCRSCHYKFFRYEIHKLSADEIASRLSTPIRPSPELCPEVTRLD